MYSTVTTSKSASNGGTNLSLVTTGEKYTWNNKQNILTAGNNIGISGSTISATNTISLKYSTSEQVVGTWIDGSTLYQKTFLLEMPTATTAGISVTTYYNTNLSIKNCIYCYACFIYGATTITNLDVNTEGQWKVRVINKNDSNYPNKILILNSSPKWNEYDVYVTIQYTK